MATTNKTNGRTLTGTVVSDKMAKTITVEVDRLKVHPKYRKQYVVTSRYTAHDEQGEFHPGDRVVIRETRPMSKTKRWIAVKKVGSSTT